MAKKLLKIFFKSRGYLVLTILLLTFCKKDTLLLSSPNNVTVWETNSQPSTSSKFSGIFEVIQHVSFSKNPYSYFISYNEFSAYFSKTPVFSIDPSTYLSVDSVSLNSVQIPFSSCYYYTNAYPVSTPMTWKATSHNGTIPSLIYKNQDSIPRYSGFLTLPDTILLSSPITMNFIDLYNFDSLQVQVIVRSNTNIMVSSFSQIVHTSSHSFSVNFTQAQVSALTASQNATISVSLKKLNKRNFLGKNYSFTNTLDFIKYSVVVM